MPKVRKAILIKKTLTAIRPFGTVIESAFYAFSSTALLFTTIGSKKCSVQIPTIVDFIQQLVLGFLEGKKCIREFTSAHSEILFVDNNRQERNIVKLLPLAEIITVLLYSVLYLKLYRNAKDFNCI